MVFLRGFISTNSTFFPVLCLIILCFPSMLVITILFIYLSTSSTFSTIVVIFSILTIYIRASPWMINNTCWFTLVTIFYRTIYTRIIIIYVLCAFNKPRFRFIKLIIVISKEIIKAAKNIFVFILNPILFIVILTDFDYII